MYDSEVKRKASSGGLGYCIGNLVSDLRGGFEEGEGTTLVVTSLLVSH